VNDTTPEPLSIKKLSSNELAIMTALWDLGQATGKELLGRIDRPLAQTTLLTYLTRLEGKGYVTRASSDRGYLFAAAVPRLSVATRLLDQVLTQFEGRLSSLVSHFVRTRDIPPDEKQRLREVLDQLEQAE
jgi:BlaI family penicillinase repressor